MDHCIFFALLDTQTTHNTCTKHNSALEKLPHYVSGRLKLTLAFFDTPEFAPVGLSSFPKVPLSKHNTDEKLKQNALPDIGSKKRGQRSTRTRQ